MQIQEIIDSIAGEFGRELDHVFKEQIKTNILIARAEAIRQSIDKHNAKSSSFISQINCIPTEIVDSAECCSVNLHCPVIKTCFKIPTPIRTRNMSNDFSYVGAINGRIPFAYIAQEEINYLLADRFAKRQIFYTYVNEYIYVFNKLNLKHVRVKGIFNNPFDVFKLNDCENQGDNDAGCAETLNIPEDLITAIKSFVYTEMRNRQVNLKDEEIPVESESIPEQ